MKKAISLLLALVLCLSLCACGGGNDNSETKVETSNSQNETTEPAQSDITIVGEWVLANSTSEQTLIINEDGTGTYSTNNSSTDLTWKYDADLKCYTLAVGEIVSAFVKAVDGVEQLLIGTNIFVHPDDYESIHAEYLAEKEQKEIDDALAYLEEKLESKTEIEYGTVYHLSDEFDITFLDAEFATHTTSYGDIVGLWLTIELTNLTDSDISWRHSPGCEGTVLIYPTTGGGYFMFEYNFGEDGKKVSTYPANETVKMKLPFSEWTNSFTGDGERYDVFEDLNASIEKYGYILGYASFTLGEVQYYIDLANIPVNG